MEFQVLSKDKRGVPAVGKAKLVTNEKTCVVELRARIRGRMYCVPMTKEQIKAIDAAQRAVDKEYDRRFFEANKDQISEAMRQSAHHLKNLAATKP